jgi:hypothetical protein
LLIPGRPYPIQIYLHVCNLYSANPDIGQRGAAEATRVKFKLEKFSHSTVSRSFKAFEQAREQELERRFGEEAKAAEAGSPGLAGAGSPDLAGAASSGGAGTGEAPGAAGRFPSVARTAARRKEMAFFFQGYCRALEGDGIEAASRGFVKGWYAKTNRLLL